ncbi:biotin-dependent carboxyltransferase family protein [Ferrimonas sediminicola]|uniref:Biotin-dependent carboxyltransferase family protein n=1 Tax=Ferrimonas sediminicola TaxID=2569538 RepID=A0A4U1BGW2_9GAMM|nr:biotin-dependent carboxyltransferase family protein [Ferrimonas sediminicola]TKB50475.1 biotin-dependent carboxyltransferase family protein [Ferrimonas sediminicola]
MSLRITELNGPASIQDQGRFGHRHLGVGWQGPMDRLAFESANWLCGNPLPAAAIELGPGALSLEFHQRGFVAYCGPAHQGILARAGGEAPLYAGYRHQVSAGDRLTLRPTGEGLYGYLAIRGGIALPELLASSSCDPALDRESLPFRPLRKGDRLPISPQTAALPTAAALGIRRYRTHLNFLPAPKTDARRLRVRVSSSLSRMGVRLESGPPWPELASQPRPVFPGAIQLPADGQPIILTRGCQTTGGYPVIGYVVQPDLDDLAQALPGCRLTLSPCTLEEALRAGRRFQGYRYLIKRGLYGDGP